VLTEMANGAAAEESGSSKNRDKTILRRRHWLNATTLLPVERVTRAIEYPIDLARHDKIVFV
jgi:hypothetical protein